jgi:hypothetical protein
MKSEKPSKSIAFAPEEEIIFPDFLQKKIPRNTNSGISGVILVFVIIVLIPVILIKFLCFCVAFDNPFEVAFAIIDIIIIYYYMRYVVYSFLESSWLCRYGIIATATITRLKSEEESMGDYRYYTYYSYKTPDGREFEGFLSSITNCNEYLDVGDRIIVLYNRRFPMWHISYKS